MWQAFVNWLTSLFGSEDPTPFEDVEYSFTGVIKDDPDSRDQIFGETK